MALGHKTKYNSVWNSYNPEFPLYLYFNTIKVYIECYFSAMIVHGPE